METRSLQSVPPLLPSGEAPLTSEGDGGQSPHSSEGVQRSTDQKMVGEEFGVGGGGGEIC